MNEYLLLNDFTFKSDFEDLTDAQFTRALQIVNAQFSGVYRLWSMLPPDEARVKRELCINYLIAWQLMTLYPDQATSVGSVAGMGGLPVTMKKAGPMMVKYKDSVRQAGSGVLDMLTTNSYGMEALAMLQSAPENYQVYA